MLAGAPFIYWLAHRCQNNKCAMLAEWLVHWPGQTTYMCDSHLLRAETIAEAMGFFLPRERLPEARRRHALSLENDSAVRFSMLELD